MFDYYSKCARYDQNKKAMYKGLKENLVEIIDEYPECPVCDDVIVEEYSYGIKIHGYNIKSIRNACINIFDNKGKPEYIKVLIDEVYLQKKN